MNKILLKGLVQQFKEWGWTIQQVKNESEDYHYCATKGKVQINVNDCVVELE